MNYIITTPEGTKDRIFAECADRRAVEQSVIRLFSRRGYHEIMTPEIEYYDLFTQSGSPLPQESMIKIIDRSGKIIVMRPDNTAPIARVAATKLKNLPSPQRLYYKQTIFRSDAAHLGTKSEIAQCGVELIGASGIRADLEVIAMAIEALEACGLVDFYVELGHVGFFRSLATELGADEAEIEQMRRLIENKNFAALNDALLPYENTKTGAALKRLSFLFGGQEVLVQARRLTDNRESVQAVEYLNSLYEELCMAGLSSRVRFDLGLVHQIDYYTGIVFRGYVHGAGSTVLSGGRYDGLIGAFGKDTPATGFAIDIDAVSDCTAPKSRPRLETIVFYESGCLNRALEYLNSFEPGTGQLSACDLLEDAILEAGKFRAVRVVAITRTGERTVTL